MRVPLSWLRDYVAVEVPVEQLAERLNISVAGVERIIRRGVADEDGNLGLFRVGRVLEAEKHPNADRLQLCRVDIGEGEPRQIVCGAWNFGEGATVAVALPGAVLPGGTMLERAKLRGETSDGMILSERELEPVPGRDPERVGDAEVSVDVEDLERCPRYVGRVLRGVTVAPSALWMKA